MTLTARGAKSVPVNVDLGLQKLPRWYELINGSIKCFLQRSEQRLDFPPSRHQWSAHDETDGNITKTQINLRRIKTIRNGRGKAADSQSWFIADICVTPDPRETKTGRKFKVYSFSSYEIRSKYFHLKLLKSEDNMKNFVIRWKDF